MSNIGFLWSPTKAMDIVSAMGTQHSNLEIVARDICARQIAHSCETPDELRRSVDRYWHIVAAQLEAGIIDESGRDLEPFDNDRRLASLRDWRARNPDHEVPPLRPSRGA